MDGYDRFPSQSFELLDGSASVIKKQGFGVSFVVRMFVSFCCMTLWEHLDYDEKKPLSEVTPNSGVNYHKGKTVYISGSGPYSLILRSRLPAARSLIK